MNSARTALRERVAALAQARRAIAAGRLDDAERILHDELSRWPGNRDAQSLLAEVARERGDPPPEPAPSDDPAQPPAVAASPEAWTSFELRVRERKAARLAERARAALESGAVTEALALVEELESIAPGHPVIEELSIPHGVSPVATPASLPDAVPERFPEVPEPFSEFPTSPTEASSDTEPGYLAATGLDAFDATAPAETAEFRFNGPLGLGLADSGPLRNEHAPPLRERSMRALGLVLLLGSAVALSGWAGYRWFTAPVATPLAQVRGAPEATRPALPAASRAGAAPRPTGTAGSNANARTGEAAPAAGQGALPSSPEAVAASSRVPSPIDPPRTTTRSPAPAVTADPGGDPAPEPPAVESNAPDDTSPDDASAMRALIEGYLAGYNNLDAGGVNGVWPAVDRRALARAFGQLASQHLVFSRCEVRAAQDEGRAFCIGRATWRPRGSDGSERTERRVWRFAFAERDGRWAIDRVDIER